MMTSVLKISLGDARFFTAEARSRRGNPEKETAVFCVFAPLR